MAEALDEHTGLTLSQLEILEEEIVHQNNLMQAAQVRALSFLVGPLSSVIGAMFSGDGSGIAAGLKAMDDYATALETATSGAPQREEEVNSHAVDVLLATHPLFTTFRANADNLVGRPVPVVTE